MEFNEKLLSLLNNNLSSMLFKIFSKLNDKNIFNKIKIFYKKK